MARSYLPLAMSSNQTDSTTVRRALGVRFAELANPEKHAKVVVQG